MHGGLDEFPAPAFTSGACSTQKHGLGDQLLLIEGAIFAGAA